MSPVKRYVKQHVVWKTNDRDRPHSYTEHNHGISFHFRHIPQRVEIFDNSVGAKRQPHNLYICRWLVLRNNYSALVVYSTWDRDALRPVAEQQFGHEQTGGYNASCVPVREDMLRLLHILVVRQLGNELIL